MDGDHWINVSAPKDSSPFKMTLAGETKSIEKFAQAGSLPFKSLCYGYRQIKKHKSVDEIIVDTFEKDERRTSRYRFATNYSLTSYIFDPIPFPDGDRIVFKYGAADIETETYRLFLFNKRDGSVRQVSDSRLRNRRVQISPDGRYISYTEGGGQTGGTTEFSSKPLELWIYDTQTAQNSKVTQGPNLLDDSDWNTPIKALRTSQELLYSRMVMRKVGGKNVGLPAIYAYNPATKVSHLYLDAAEVALPSPDGKTLLYLGPLKRDLTYLPETGLSGLRFKSRVAKTSAAVELPQGLLERGEILPTSFTYWSQDSSYLLSLSRQYDLNKLMQKEFDLQATWYIVKITVDAPGRISRMSRLTTATVMSHMFEPELSLFSQLPAQSGISVPIAGTSVPSATEEKNALSAALVFKTFLKTASPNGNGANILNRSYEIRELNVATGALKPILVLSEVRGLGGLNRDGTLCRSAYY